MEEQERKLTPESNKISENFQIFGVASFLFSCFYAFCMGVLAL